MLIALVLMFFEKEGSLLKSKVVLYFAEFKCNSRWYKIINK